MQGVGEGQEGGNHRFIYIQDTGKMQGESVAGGLVCCVSLGKSLHFSGPGVWTMDPSNLKGTLYFFRVTRKQINSPVT